MKRERPINADLPQPAAPEPPEPPAADPPAPAAAGPARKTVVPKPESNADPRPGPAPEEKPRRQPGPGPERRSKRSRPLTPFLLAGLVAIAIAFVLVAVIAGTGGGRGGSGEAAPSQPAGGSGSTAAEALGYPAFATNNTTRIGGSEPATIAAAAALAVYPSTTPALRPAAVTLVSAEDWAGAVAAAVLMAEPVRAPVLFANADGLPAASEEALSALAPAGSPKSGGSSVFAVGAVMAPAGSKSTAVAAGPAASEAAAIAALRNRLFGSPPAAIVVAPSSSPAIAMPAAAWAARSGDPVLYAGREDLPAATASALRRDPRVPVYVLGPASAISPRVEAEIAKTSKRVTRVSGDGPVANALAFARFHDGAFGWDVNDPGHGFVLARADSPLDAAAAAALSGSGTWGPLLLTDSATKLPAEVRSYFLDVKPGYTDNPTRAFYNHVWVIGDEEAIDVNQQAEVDELAELARIGGAG